MHPSETHLTVRIRSLSAVSPPAVCRLSAGYLPVVRHPPHRLPKTLAGWAGGIR